MQSFTGSARAVALWLLTLGALTPLFGATIYETGPGRETKESDESTLAFDFERGGVFLTQSFLLSQSFSHVSIMANFTNTAESKAWVSVFLTNQIGRETTVERNEYKDGSARILVDAKSRDVSTTLFSDLTLTAGAYFVTFSSASTDLLSIQTVVGEVTTTAARGVTPGQYGTGRVERFNPEDYVPSADFELFDYGKWPTAAYLTVTSELDEVIPPPETVSTPEPMSFALMACGLAGICWHRRSLSARAVLPLI